MHSDGAESSVHTCRTRTQRAPKSRVRDPPTSSARKGHGKFFNFYVVFRYGCRHRIGTPPYFVHAQGAYQYRPGTHPAVQCLGRYNTKILFFFVALLERNSNIYP